MLIQTNYWDPKKKKKKGEENKRKRNVLHISKKNGTEWLKIFHALLSMPISKMSKHEVLQELLMDKVGKK